MLLKEKKYHHIEMIAELETFTLQDKYIRENESPYLIDYLYGVSDLDQEVSNFLSEIGLEDRWIIFYRCLIKSDILEKKQYDKLRKYKENLFLIRDELDLKEIKEFLESQKIEKTEIQLIDLLEKIKDMVNQKNKEKGKQDEIDSIDDLFCDGSIKENFVKLLKTYINLDKKKNKDEWEKSIYDLDVFLMEKDVTTKIEFTKTDFMEKVLKLSKDKVAKIKKKYEGGAK